MSFQKLRPGEILRNNGGVELTDGLKKSERNNQKNASIVKEKYGNKKYYEPGIKDRLVNGKYSIPDTTNKDSINSYIKAYYDEYFYGIDLENQIIERVGTFNNPVNTLHFQKGYERGRIIVSFNDEKMLPEEYQTIKKKHK